MFPQTVEYDKAKKGISGITVMSIALPSFPVEHYLQITAELYLYILAFMSGFAYFYFIRIFLINKPLQSK